LALQKLEVVIGANTSGFNKGVKNVQSGVNGMKSSFAGLKIGALAAVAAITAISVASVKMMQAYAGLRNSVQRTNELFRDSNKYIKYFADNTAKAFGMSETTAYQYASTYGNLFKGMTKDTQENAKVTIAMMKSSAVIASKTGRTMEDVNERIRSGILGNTEAIEDLGIHVPIAMIKTTKAFKDIAKGASWESLTYQQQQQIRVLAILEQSTNQYGSSVSQIAGMSLPRLGQAFKDLMSYAGMFVTKALQPIINGLGYIVVAATQALKSLAKLFGWDLAGGVKPSDIAVQQGFGEATDDTTDSIDKQKKALKGLSGLDEINVLSSPKTDAGGPAGGGASVSSPFDGIAMPEYKMPSIDTSAMEKSVGKIKSYLSPLKAINFEPLVSAFGRLKIAVSPIVKSLFEGLDWAYQNILVPLAKWTIEDLAPAFLDALAGASDLLSSAVDALKPLASWLWDNFLQPIAEWTGGAIVSTLEGLGKALSAIGDWISNNQAAFNAMVVTVGLFALAWKGIELGEFIINAGGIIGILGKLKAATLGVIAAKIKDKVVSAQLIGLYIKDAVVKAASAVKTAVLTVATKLAAIAQGALNLVMAMNPIMLIVLAVAALVAAFILLWNNCEGFRNFFIGAWEAIKTAVEVAWNAIVAVFQFAWEAIKAYWNFAIKFYTGIWDGIKKVFSAVVTFFTNIFTGAWDGIKTAFSKIGGFFTGIWTGIKNVFSGVATWFGNIFAGAWQAVKNVFSTGGKIFDGIKDGILNGLKVVINGLIGGINKIIKIPFDGINFALSKIKDISIAGIKPFSWIGTINTPQIPKLAKGGIVDSPTVAMVGEAGKEAVMPLENNTGWITQLADKIAVSISGNQMAMAGGDTVIPIYLDGNMLDEIIVNAQRRRTVRSNGR